MGASGFTGANLKPDITLSHASRVTSCLSIPFRYVHISLLVKLHKTVKALAVSQTVSARLAHCRPFLQVIAASRQSAERCSAPLLPTPGIRTGRRRRHRPCSSCGRLCAPQGARSRTACIKAFEKSTRKTCFPFMTKWRRSSTVLCITPALWTLHSVNIAKRLPTMSDELEAVQRPSRTKTRRASSAFPCSCRAP
jgi:hypothetical protein